MRLDAFPLTHYFVAFYLWLFHPRAKKLFTTLEDIVEFVAGYQVEGYCRCGECATFYLSCSPEKNLLANDEMLFEQWDGMHFIPKAYNNDHAIDFEIVKMVDEDKRKTLPFYEELVIVFESKKPSTLPSEDAKIIIEAYFKKSLAE